MFRPLINYQQRPLHHNACLFTYVHSFLGQRSFNIVQQVYKRRLKLHPCYCTKRNNDTNYVTVPVYLSKTLYEQYLCGATPLCILIIVINEELTATYRLLQSPLLLEKSRILVYFVSNCYVCMLFRNCTELCSYVWENVFFSGTFATFTVSNYYILGVLYIDITCFF